MKTAQQVFDTTLHHLRKQGTAATAQNQDGRLRCAYRGENGTSCAIGCHIPDSLYLPEYEGRRASTLPMLEALSLAEHKPLLNMLQGLHDVALTEYGLAAWECGMKNYAGNRGLNYTPA